ncbi:2-oxoglutarate-dependent dioxygenase ucsF-like [Pollicipes pollicipes]|uniref:2-oxoglutarate-dependent dioxygenase ucsF-like n=1 Tax=Pollicipes pollicipes TaxID=41117 RepID=UPI001885004B|nr:2-oxoglutarate-dependent dioxygenase ucsF-like [Pollicipes pollicipes]
MAEIQIIDISEIALPSSTPSQASLLTVGSDIVRAFRLTGFAYLRGHGVPLSLQADTFTAARAFFALDEASKLRFERFARTGYNGYTPVGGENTGRLRAHVDLLDLKECYDFHIFGEDYPDAVMPGFSQQLEKLALACCKLSDRLLAALQEALVQEQPADRSQQLSGNRPTAQLTECHQTEDTPPAEDHQTGDRQRAECHQTEGNRPAEDLQTGDDLPAEDHQTGDNQRAECHQTGSDRPAGDLQTGDNPPADDHQSGESQRAECHQNGENPRAEFLQTGGNRPAEDHQTGDSQRAECLRTEDGHPAGEQQVRGAEPLPPVALTAGHRRMLRHGGCAALRVLSYPPVPATVAPGAVRCASHTDYGTMTLLFQDELGGLEVETADGVWTPAPPVPDTILVNVGDLMETWSSGRLRATKHRVVIPKEEALRRRARQSIAMFVEPDDDVLVRPLDGDPRFAAVNAGEALRRKFAKTYPAFASRLRKQ